MINNLNSERMKATPEQIKELLKWAVEKTGDKTFDEQNSNWLMNEFLKSKPDDWEIVSEDKTKNESVLPLQIVSRWAYLYDNAKPLMIGFIAAMLLNTTYKLIETIIIKIALIING